MDVPHIVSLFMLLEVMNTFCIVVVKIQTGINEINSFPVLQSYIFADLRNRTELIFAWLYQEYAKCMNFMSTSGDSNNHNMSSYDECISRILNALLDVTDQKEV